WEEVKNSNGELLYKYKVSRKLDEKNKVVDYDDFTYKCKINPDDKDEIAFTVKEKRIVTYNPLLAKKRRHEIQKEC
ncbi:MAG: hypothetical protein PUD59_02620, partial [bacterium]|nr:hypothetical protein [bacterium]